jgi:hypothetical protein
MICSEIQHKIQIIALSACKHSSSGEIIVMHLRVIKTKGFMKKLMIQKLMAAPWSWLGAILFFLMYMHGLLVG